MTEIARDTSVVESKVVNGKGALHLSALAGIDNYTLATKKAKMPIRSVEKKNRQFATLLRCASR